MTAIIEASGMTAHVQHSDVKLVLAALGREWQRVRVERNAKYPPNAGTEICRYCSKSWANWKGTKLEGHALCVAPYSFMQLVVHALGRADCRFADVANALGLSIGVLRSWWKLITVTGRSTAGTRPSLPGMRESACESASFNTRPRVEPTNGPRDRSACEFSSFNTRPRVEPTNGPRDRSACESASFNTRPRVEPTNGHRR